MAVGSSTPTASSTIWRPTSPRPANVAAQNHEITERLEGLLEQAREELGDGPNWPVDPGIDVPATARPIGLVDDPKLLIPRPGKTGSAAHEPPIKTKKVAPPPPDWVRPSNW